MEHALQDWRHVQSFLAVAETGSLSKAAQALGLSQPTLGRHIQAIETALGLSLFERHARGLHLSDSGETLLPHARAMRDALAALNVAVAGRDAMVEGTVRITASIFASHHILPPIMARMRQAEPLIRLELAPTDSSENLLFREADIAVRMYRPTQLDIVTRHVTDIALGTFAARAYLDRRGRPEHPHDLLNHDLVGYDRSDLILRAMNDMGLPVTRDHFTTRCDMQTTYWELVRAGCGIGFSQRAVALADPAVEEILPEMEVPSLPVWLAAPQAMRQTPRIRRIWDLLADALASLS